MTGEGTGVGREATFSLEEIVGGLESTITVPTRPHMGESYISAFITTQLNDIIGTEEIEFAVDSISSSEDEPVSILIVFTLGEQLVEKTFSVRSILYAKLQYISEMYYVVRDGNSASQDIEAYFLGVFDKLDVKPENVVVSYSSATGTLEVGYPDKVLGVVDIVKVNFDESTTMHPIINSDFDDLLVQKIKEQNVSLTDSEVIDQILLQVLGDAGVIDPVILQHVHTREFVIIPLTYRYGGESLQYRFIITRLSVNGVLDYDDDSSDSGLYPPGSEKVPNSRFAMSALSRSRASTAMNQELITEKNIGQFLVKDYNGNVVSYDKISRQKSFERQTITEAKLSGLFGDVSRLEFDNMTMPWVIVPSQNVMTPVTLTGPKLPAKVSLSIDLDTILLGKDSTLASHPTSTEAVFVVIVDGVEEEVTVVKDTNSILTLNLSNRIGGTTHEVKLKSIKFDIDERYISRNTRLVLNDVIVIIEEREEE